MKRYFLILISGLLFYNLSLAQLTVTGGLTATQLAEILAGPDITVSGATLTGDAVASGSFNGSLSNIGLSSGVILSTGNINQSPGPNTATNSGSDLGEPGTAQMTALAGAATEDAITLQFSFEVQSEMIQFSYVFASEEYPEYAPPNSSSYNDVFAFYISGPGITGEENIALLPGTSDVVSINNINAITNNMYYISNAGGTTVQFDAFTTELIARKDGLIPCQTYTLKLVIADAGDGVYNSAVFLQENSLIQGVVAVQTQTINSDDIALEGCVDASFDFSLEQPLTYDYTIDFTIAGSATNGIDYEFIDHSITIPAGQTAATIIIQAIQDGFAEGQESIYLIYKPEICSDFDTAQLFIDDAVPIEFSIIETNLDCYEDNSGEIFVDATGGFPPYTFHLTDESSTTTLYSTNPMTGLAAGTYSVQVYDIYGCKAEALVIGGSFDAGVTFLPDGSGVTYTSSIVISGFDPGQTLDDLSMLQQICANMEHSYLGDLQIRITSPTGQSCILKQFSGGGSTDLGEPVATGPVDGGAGSGIVDPGNGFDYCFNADPDYGTMVAESYVYQHTYVDNVGHNLTDYYLPAGSYIPYQPLSTLLGSLLNGTWTLSVTDQFALDNGYIFNWNISLISDLPDTVAVLTQPDGMDVNGFVTQAQCGGSDGAINITVNGDVPPFTYLWSNSATTEDISGIPSGSYSVTVTDNADCHQTESFILNNISSINTSKTITHITCNGGNNGAITLTTSGGTAPYTYAWSSGQTTQSVSGLVAGTYNLTITDNTGCIYLESFTINQNPPISVATVSVLNEICSSDNGLIDINPSGGTGSYAYAWSNGATTQDIIDIPYGTYSVTVTDGNGCFTTRTYSIINDVSNCSAFCFLDISSSSITNDLCGSGTGAIDITLEDVTFPYVINWSNGATTEDISNLVFGNYTVTINDANNCQLIETITVPNNTGTLDITSSNVTNETCGNDLGAIDITLSGGSLPYTYSWSNSATSQDIAGLAAGNYTINITDGSNCVLSETFTVANNTGTMNVAYDTDNDICDSGQGSITQTVTGAFGSVSYHWSTGPTTASLVNLHAGTYICTITDAAGCNTIETYYITNSPGTMHLSSTVVTNETCNNNSGAINLTIAGGGGGYTYNWSTGATTEDVSGLNEGIYHCTITDINSCFVHTGYIYVFNDAGNLAVENQFITDEICNNQHGAANVNITGGTTPYVYHWSNGSTAQDLLNVHDGNYTLTVTDANGCITEHMVEILNTPGDLEILAALVTNEICGNSQGDINITLDGGTTPYSYIWSSGQTSQDLINVAEGTYSCTISDVNGCVVNYTGTIENNASTLATSTVITSEICSNSTGSIDLTLTGGASPYTYLWSSGQTTQDISGLSGGVYSCEITDNSGCHINTGIINIYNNPGTLNATAVSTDETCSNDAGSINVTTTGGATPYSYIWTGGATTEDLSGLSAGTYYCTITDINGCEVIISKIITNTPGTLAISNALVSNETCNDNLGAIDLTISGGTSPYTYLWSNAQTTQDMVSLNEGNYTCTVSDANGCQVISSVYTVANNPGSLALTDIIITDENCSNGLGRVNITISGGVTPITYLWSNSAITQDIIGLHSGNYACTVTDATGCKLFINATVGNNSGTLNVNNSVVTNEACNNNAGAIDISVQGGTIPYTYLWNYGQTTQDISGLSEGNFEVQITDDNGCIITFVTEILNLGSDLDITSVSISDEMCGNNAGAINITTVGGNTPYSYIWSNGNIFEDVSGVAAGNYNVTITDNNGCTVTDGFTINENNGTLNLISVNAVDESCGEVNGSIDVTFSGGFAPVTYLWNTGAVTQDLTGIPAGNYIITITDTYGCNINASETIVNLSGGFEISNSVAVNESCADEAGSIDLTITGGLPPYSYTWNTGAVTEDLSGLSAGTYNCTVTDANLCSILFEETIINQTTGIAISNSVTQNETCGNNVGFIDQTISGGTTPYSYNWSSGQVTQDLVGLSEGTYTCSVSDNTGCVVIGTYVVENDGGDFTVSSVIQSETCTNSQGLVNITVSGGMPPYTYLWSSGQMTQDITNVTTGNYTVTIMDDVGCDYIAEFEVGYLDNPNLGFASVNDTNESCGNGNGVVSVSPAYPGTYIYTLNGSSPSSMTPYPNWTGLSAGTYVASISDANGCIVESDIELINTAPYSTSLSHLFDDNCGNGEGAIDISVSPAGTYMFEWSNGETSEDIYNLNGGTYSCTISDETGCLSYLTQNIENTTTVAGSGTATEEYCGDATGSIDLTISSGTPPYTYTWNNGETTEDIGSLSAGNYSVTATDNTGCSEIFDFTVANNTGTLSVTGTVTNDNCYNATGAVNLNITGGSGNYAFGWSNGASTEDISGLIEGIYEVVVFDLDLNCRVTQQYEVINNAPFDVTFTQVTNIACGEFNSGAIEIFLYPSTGSYTYIWNNGATTLNQSGLSAGNYFVTISNSVGCDEILSFEVLSESNIAASSVITNENCSDGTGTVNLSVTGGIAPYSYSWSNGQTTQDISSLHADTYTCTVTDSEGCIAIEEAIITNGTSLTSSTVITDESCGDNQGSIDLTITGGTAPYEYEWSNGFTSQNIESLAEGTYTVTITDQNNCVLVVDAFVDNNTGTLAVTGIVDDDYCYNADGSITLVITGGSGDYAFDWSNGSTNQNVTGLTEGIYTVMVFDIGLNCRLTEEFTVGNTGSFSISSNFITDASCSTCDDGAINITLSGGGGPFNYDWSNGGGTQDISDLLPGTYTVTIENGSGCIIVETFEVGFLTIISGFEQTSSITVYPNPSEGLFNIEMPKTARSNMKYSVVDILGKEVVSGTISNSVFQLDLSGNKAGFYQLIFENGMTVKLVITQ
ncbi:MAG: hypothetical protein A2W91_20315 [Bacteroidetes bacterium GWF2_38_335]|nr:MAG: hypothetical protein A2W91_20315 [Bacteroidetes bacterium GWF2_38_335]OFY79494.1 MAG: hypothetical protein A2281_13770 [Bacteroidetes bacterium RIFOXYA12_FULL_38_20]HBS86567.1 hypothetical protein [Bacteroidales bacterium]